RPFSWRSSAARARAKRSACRGRSVPRCVRAKLPLLVWLVGGRSPRNALAFGTHRGLTRGRWRRLRDACSSGRPTRRLVAATARWGTDRATPTWDEQPAETSDGAEEGPSGRAGADAAAGF